MSFFGKIGSQPKAVVGLAVVILFLLPPAMATEPFASVADQIKRGGAIYASEGCEECHGATGLGDVGPVLAGNEALADICNIFAYLRGDTEHMPRLVLGDGDIAAVATYIRNEWGNEFGVVTPADLAGC
jgi:mono/diheme cytochrome c family protein